MISGGYSKRILHINLSTQEIMVENSVEGDLECFLGGEGMNYNIAAKNLDPTVDPLSPENIIILGTGPFSGTIVPGSAKLSATTKFPLNDTIGTAIAGGRFPLMLKSSGYDHVVIKGLAKKPTYLIIQDNKILFEDAGNLWGKDIYKTTSELVSMYEPCSVICIGAAGENRVRISMAFVDGMYHLGTGGLGAVMGSKNLKAIIASQGNSGIEISDRLTLQKIVDNTIDRMTKWPLRLPLVNGGMMGDALNRRLLQPSISKNWSFADFSGPEEIGPEVINFTEKFVLKHKENRHSVACPSCPMSCNEWSYVKDGIYAGTVVYGHFNWIFPGSGDIYGRSAKYFSELNRHGICLIDFGSLRQLIIHLQELGVLTTNDIGFKVREDDLEGTLELINMTAHRKGFGNTLADGLRGIVQKIPNASKYVIHIKYRGLHPSFEARVRGLGTSEFTMLTNPRGAHIATGGSPSFTPGRSPADFKRHAQRIGMPEEAINRIISESDFNPGRYTRYSEDWVMLFNSLGQCNRHFVNRFYYADRITELYNAITGLKLKTYELLKAAERSWNLCRILNFKAGFNKTHDLPPDIWFVPLKTPNKEVHLHNYYKNKKLSRQDVEKFLNDYYEERGWDITRGIPTVSKLNELNLGQYLHLLGKV